MTHELIGNLSGAIVFLSGLLYFRQVLKRRVTPNTVSWSIWAVIGFALWINYKTTGAKENAEAAFWGMINPILIAVAAFWKGESRRPDILEIFCLLLAAVSIAMWWKLSSEMADKALYVAILADVCGAVPLAKMLWKNPEKDRPMMWIVFALGYALSIFAIPDNDQSFTNYVLPVYMVVMSGILSWFLIRYRVKMKHPFSEWY